ncbi:MAG: hypothetical protein R3B06_13810 [Kofleriaceae bacterium]
MRAAPAALVALAAMACGTFEDPAIVLDLRAIAVVAEPPEQVFEIDPANPTLPTLGDVTVCAAVADPLERQLTFEVTVCPPTRDLRCDPTLTQLALAPVTTIARGEVTQVACAVVPGEPALPAVVRQTIERDALQGFGGVDVNLALRVVPVGGGEVDAIYAAKGLRFSAKLPAERVANRNPEFRDLTGQITRPGGVVDVPIELPRGGCAVGGATTLVPSGATVKLAPHAVDGAAETYVVPTFEGGARTFTENLRFQWLATAGSYSRGDTGGPRDSAGNPAVVTTEWTAPTVEADAPPRPVDLWVVMRDERGGANWLSTCLTVEPTP